MPHANALGSGAIALASRPAELNLDSLVGPTHNYAGLARGNLLSQAHAHLASSPRRAALEGLDKMLAVRDLLAPMGLLQGVLPPQHRPDVGLLRRLGFTGEDAQVLADAARRAPRLLAMASSASAMWAANAATVSPSVDSAAAADGQPRLHLTPANLSSHAHRALEAAQTATTLRAIFADTSRFAVHDPLPAAFGDEGAANHTRLAADHGSAGVELFVYGRDPASPDEAAPRRFPARQNLEASRAIARLHRLDPARMVFARQHPEAIDAGVFHNDVAAVGNGPVLLAHELAFDDRQSVLADLRRALAGVGVELVHVEVSTDAVPLDVAVRTYLFNSQLLTLADGAMVLVAPTDCRREPRVVEAIDAIIADAGNPIAAARYVDVRESMRNGGGPACLRLRVPLTPAEHAAMHPGVLLTDALAADLRAWITRHYRDRLEPADLADPALLAESASALDELSGILGLGAIYPFQREGAMVW